MTGKMPTSVTAQMTDEQRAALGDDWPTCGNCGSNLLVDGFTVQTARWYHEAYSTGEDGDLLARPDEDRSGDNIEHLDWFVNCAICERELGDSEIAAALWELAQGAPNAN